MVRRALQGRGSQYDDFVAFSRDLIYERENVYAKYASSITKYPPFFGFLFAPLVPLPTPVGASIWFWLNVALAYGAARLSARAVRESPEDAPLPTTLWAVPLALAAGIVGSNLETAQVNILLLFLLVLALYEFRRGRDLWAGAWLGLATALKLTPAVFIAYFAYKRAYRTVLGAGLAIVLCWTVIPLTVLGPDNGLAVTRGWVEDLVPYFARGTIAEGITGFRDTNQSLSAAFHRFFTATPAAGGSRELYVNVASLGYETAERIVKGLSAAILLAVAWVCRSSSANRRSVALAFEYSLVMIATLLVSPISWINHYVVLLFPYAAAVYYLRTRPREEPRRAWVACALAGSFLLVSSSAWRVLQSFSLPFFGALALGVALAAALLAIRRVERSLLRSSDRSGPPQGRSLSVG